MSTRTALSRISGWFFFWHSHDWLSHWLPNRASSLALVISHPWKWGCYLVGQADWCPQCGQPHSGFPQHNPNCACPRVSGPSTLPWMARIFLWTGRCPGLRGSLDITVYQPCDLILSLTFSKLSDIQGMKKKYWDNKIRRKHRWTDRCVSCNLSPLYTWCWLPYLLVHAGWSNCSDAGGCYSSLNLKQPRGPSWDSSYILSKM